MFPILGAIAVIIGVVILLVALFAKDKLSGTMLANPWLAIIVAVSLILIGGMPLGGFEEVQGWMETDTAQIDDDTSDTGYQYADFDIDVSVEASEGTLSSDETTITVPAVADQTAYSILQTDNSTGFVDPDLKFTINPDTWAGATNDDLATIYYEVRNADVTVDASDDTYYLFTKSGGNRQCIWDDGSTSYVSGSSTYTLTETGTIYLNSTVDEASFAHMENTFDPVTVYIDFYNGDHSFSKTYQVRFELI